MLAAPGVEEEWLTVEAQLNAGMMHRKIEICDTLVYVGV